jgi:hypothetical protein
MITLLNMLGVTHSILGNHDLGECAAVCVSGLFLCTEQAGWVVATLPPFA